MLDLLLYNQKTTPDFVWDARSGILPPGAIFTRASAGWTFNSSGVLVSNATNAPRFDYDPATLAPLGYLAEVQSTNAVTQSQNLGTAWSASNITLTNSAVTAPDGTTTAAALLLGAGLSLHQIQSTISYSYNNGDVLGISCFVKEITGGQWVQFTFGGNAGFNFQPSTGTIGSSLSGAQSRIGARQLANGWWRIWFSFTAPANTSSALAFNFTAASNSTAAVSMTGDGTSKVAVWGFQIDTAGVGVTSYIPTAGSTVTRACDLLTMPLTSMPGWRAGVGGVLVAAYRLFTVRSTACVAAIVDSGAFTNALLLYENYANGGSARFSANSGSLIQLGGAASPSVFVRRKMAGGWGPSQQIAHDGVFDNSATGQVPMSLVNLQVGTDDGTNGLNGVVESVAYYAGARSNAFVQTVSR